MRFEPAFLDEIRDRLPCSEVCGRRVVLKKAGREWRGLSPFNAEKTPSFFVNDTKRAWFDFSSGRNGNVFDFLIAVDGLSFPQAVEECARDAGLPMPRGFDRARPPTAQEQAERAARQVEHDRRQAERREAEATTEDQVRAIARRVWTEGQPIAGTPADRYLRGRGIDFGDQFPALRFHQRLEHRDPETGFVSYWPALIAAVQHPTTDRFLAVWRIWVTDDGSKAPIDSQKMGLGTFAPYGGAVRLGRPTAAANPCEGIETGLAVWAILGGRQGVQATTSTSGLVNFVRPAGCVRTLIWPDGDRDRIRVDRRTGEEIKTRSPGLVAASTLRGLMIERGEQVAIQPIPKRGLDWLDVWQKAKDKFDE